jgi:hypothetical protein
MPIDPADIAHLTIYPGVQEIAQSLEAVLGASYEGLLSEIAEGWRKLGPELTPITAREVVSEKLLMWPELTAGAYADLIDNIFYAGFMVGVVDTGVRIAPDHGDAMALDWIKGNPDGFVPALRRFADDERKFFEEVLRDAYAGVDREGKIRPFSFRSMIDRVQARTGAARSAVELVVRTETAKVTSLGRIAAWDNDADKYLYDYHWVATHDDRTKDVSLLFERDGPYEFDGIKKRWTDDHNKPWPVVNRRTNRLEYQTSAYNCRCTAARTPKSPERMLEQGLITRGQYEAMVA